MLGALQSLQLINNLVIKNTKLQILFYVRNFKISDKLIELNVGANFTFKMIFY